MICLSEYDERGNTAYIRLVDIPAGGVDSTTNLYEEHGIMLDWDAEGHLLGIEVLDAKKVLKPELLAAPMGTLGVY